MECEKHPNKYRNKTPQEFTDEYLNWSEKQKKEFYLELTKEYTKQSINDKKLNHPKLSKNLETLATTTYLTSIFIEAENNKINQNENIEKIAQDFGNTNYYYQQEVFKKLKTHNPKIFETTIKAITKVCNTCKKYLKNPYAKKS